MAVSLVRDTQLGASFPDIDGAFTDSQIGDMLVCVVLMAGNAADSSIETGTYWTPLVEDFTNAPSWFIGYHKCLTTGGAAGANGELTDRSSTATMLFWCGQFRGMAEPVVGDLATIFTSSSTSNIGAITGLTAPAGGGVLVAGGRADDWTSVATLSGESLTWVEDCDLANTTGTGADGGLVVNHALTAGSTAIANKTFTVTGGGAAAAFGQMLKLRPATATLSGTGIASITEADVVAGGKTLIVTLDGTSWVASGATFDAQRDEIRDGFDSAQSEGTGWDAVVKAGQGVAGVVRTSDFVMTLTLDAFATYDITAQETITCIVPSTAIVLAAAITAAPTLTVDTAGGSVPADLVLGTIAAVAVVSNLTVGTPRINLGAIAAVATVANLVVATPAPIVPGAIAAVASVANLVVATPAPLALDPVVGVAVVSNLLVSSPTVLALGAIAGVAALSNITIGSPSLTLQTIVAVSTASALVESPGTAVLVLASIDSVAAVSNLLISAPTFLALDAIAGVASVSNVLIQARAILSLSTIEAVAALTNVLIKAPTYLALGSVDAVSSVSNVEIGTPLLTLQAIAGAALVSLVLTTPAILTLSQINAIASLTIVLSAGIPVEHLVKLLADYTPYRRNSADYTPTQRLEADYVPYRRLKGDA
jgi:hypothetical protein